jgi:hypothetical protein
MRVVLASLLAGSLVAAPLAAHADATGCLVGPSDVNPCSLGGSPAAILGAIAAPVIIAGAAVTVANELSRRTVERAPDDDAATKTASGKKARPSLALVPDPPDPYRAPAGKPERRARPSGAFQFNETATNVATAVTGAMVVGAIIADIVHETHHK